jgi:hypothetical protein
MRWEFWRVVAVNLLALGVGLGLAHGQDPAPGGPGPFVRMVRHNDGSRTVTAKDSAKAEQEVLTYDIQGDLKLRRVYQLDRYGKAVTFVIHEGSGKPVIRGEFTYDVRDRMTEERLYSIPGNQLMRQLVQEYDPKTGKKLAPRVKNYASLPSELLYWMDPDSAGSAGAQVKAAAAAAATGAKSDAKSGSGGKSGLFRGMFKKDKGN